MVRTPRHPINAQLISVWLERYRGLQQQLASDPDGSWAWLCSMRCDILGYLLRRYGDEITARDLLDTPPPRPVTPQHEPTSLQWTISPQAPGVEAGRGAAHPPRARRAFCDRLRRLRRVNDEVRWQALRAGLARLDPQSWIVRRSYPERGFTSPHQPPLSAKPEPDPRELDQIRDVLPSGVSLTEEQIVAIIDGREAS